MSIRKTLKIFKNPSSKVSCHWLISKRGKIYQVVEEKNIAWHCGLSRWKKLEGLNKNSIGIELDNPGHGNLYKRILAFSNEFSSFIVRSYYKKI